MLASLARSVRRRGLLRVEELESRTVLSVADPANLVIFPAAHFASPSYNGGQSPSGYWPAQIRHAYGFDQLSYNGLGQTVAIVDAYDDPNIFSDLDTFDQTLTADGVHSLYSVYGAANTWLTKGTPQGQPAADAGWASEIALDVEWAHAIAPAAKIVLVEAASSSLGNLLDAVDYAAGQGTYVGRQAAQVVSMSWGAGEFSSETHYDGHFVHSGVTFVASSGDYGAPPEWPAISPHVLAVGGSNLKLSSTDTWNGETGWGNGPWSPWYGGSGGGISRYEPKPSFQSSVTQSSSRRTNPDVAYVADPNTGLAVYDSFGSGGWAVYGGTSVGAPQWAGLISLVDQAHGSAVTGDAQILPAIYQIYKSSNYSADFHDIVSGNNGYKAGTGYDLVTGVGSPKANSLIPALVSAAGSASPSAAIKTPGSTPSPSNVQLPNVFKLSPPPQTTFITSTANTPITVSVQPTVSVVLPVPGSAPFLAAPARPVESRIESGGGENGILVDDDAADQLGRGAVPISNEDVAANPETPVAVNSAPNLEMTAVPDQARDACFADVFWTADAVGSSTESGASQLDFTDGGLSLAAVFGGYWLIRSLESKRRQRRFANE